MFSVIISEKGGAERRESFDRTEINVGRVQGNDLMLPKGNVSKRHARLLFRDGRFIVTDLKSTNGTYVNGRKIAQATIVREGDKIYIGDFVIRIETGAAAAQPSHQPPPAPPSPADEPSEEPFHEGDAGGPRPPSDPSPVPAPVGLQTSAQIPVSSMADAYGSVQDGAVALPRAPLAPTGLGAGGATAALSPLPFSPPIADPPSSSQPSSKAERGLGRALSPKIEPKSGERQEIISHFPLEHDPDDSMLFAVPGPPRVPSGAMPRSAPQSPKQPFVPVEGVAPTKPPVSDGGAVPKPFAAPDRVTSPSMGIVQTLQGQGAFAPAPQQPVPAPVPASAPVPVPIPAPVSVPVPVPIPVHDTPAKLARDGAASSPKPRAAQEPVPVSSPTPITPAVAPRRAIPPSSFEAAEPEPTRMAARRAAVVTLIERVADAVDLRVLDGGAPPDDAITARIDRALRERSQAMRAQGEIRADLDLDTLLAEARRELLEYGPLSPLFDDEDVSEIQVIRNDHVVAIHGRQQVPSELGFSAEHAVGRVVRRLCVAAGKPLAPGETFVERRFPSTAAGARKPPIPDGGRAPIPPGARMFAVLPPAADHGHMLVIRKPQRADLTLEDLVRSGTISRAMAGLFAQCIEARANILVTGAVGAGTTSLLGALAAAGSTTDRVVVLQEDDELIFNQPHTVSILLGDTAAEGARAVQAAARVRPDRLVVGAFAGTVAAEVVDAMGDGVDGVLAAARAPTLRQAVVRLTADLAATKPGLTPDVAREWLASAFDVAIEIARLRDGRHRVLRVSELAIEGAQIILRDVFTFAVERTAAGGAVEGSFHPTGIIPGIVDDLAARGIAVDPAIFKRHAGTPRERS